MDSLILRLSLSVALWGIIGLLLRRISTLSLLMALGSVATSSREPRHVVVDAEKSEDREGSNSNLRKVKMRFSLMIKRCSER